MVTYISAELIKRVLIHHKSLFAIAGVFTGVRHKSACMFGRSIVKWEIARDDQGLYVGLRCVVSKC